MEEPTINPEVLYRPKEFSDEIILARIKQITDTLNNVPMNEDEEEAFVEEANKQVAELLDIDLYIDGMVDVLGYASYTGSDIDEQTGDSELLFARDLYFDGAQIVKPSGEAEYKALLVFSEAVELPIDDNDDDTDKQKFYFMRPEDVVLLDPGLFWRHTGEQLKQYLERFAVQAETIVNSNTFKSATGQKQKMMLINQLEKSSEFIESQYSGDTISVQVDTFTMMWPGEDGPNIQHVSPANSKGDRLTQIVGKTDGCTYLEMLTETWDNPVTKLMHDHPSMVVQAEDSDVIYLIPIRSINSLSVVKTQF